MIEVCCYFYTSHISRAQFLPSICIINHYLHILPLYYNLLSSIAPQRMVLHKNKIS